MLLSRKLKTRIFSYSTIAKFRNADYKLCNFSNLKVIDNKEPEWSKEEGYGVSKTGIQFPRMAQDLDNAYNHICTGINIVQYDKKLHRQYRLYELNKDYDTINVFGKEIYYVDLDHSTIASSNIAEIRFNICNLNNVIFDEVHFKKTNFYQTKFSHSLFENCSFSNVEFENERPAKFFGTIFVNVEFNDTRFQQVQFFDCTFITCTFHNSKFYNCHFSGQFIGCSFVNLETPWCTTPSLKRDNYNLNHFKALCQNCSFE